MYCIGSVDTIIKFPLEHIILFYIYVPFRKYSPDTFELTRLNKKANTRKRFNKYIQNNNISE